MNYQRDGEGQSGWGTRQVQSYKQLARGQIGKNKYLVVSEREDGKVSIIQQLEAITDTVPYFFFMKNAIVVDKGGLQEVIDVLSDAMDVLERGG